MTRVFTMRDAYGRTDLRGPLAFDEQRKRMIGQVNDAAIGEYAAGFLGKDELIVAPFSERRTYKDHVPTSRS